MWLNNNNNDLELENIEWSKINFSNQEDNNSKNESFKKIIEEWEKQKEEDLKNAEKWENKIKNTENSKKIWEVLKNWNVFITNEVKEKFINFGETMWFNSNSPISIILKAIWENYLWKWEIAHTWLIMIQEYLKYDIKKWIHWWGDKRWEKIDEKLLELWDGIQAFTAIYPKILWEMFWTELWDLIKEQLNWYWMNITEENEKWILWYYKDKDFVTKIFELTDWNMWWFSAIMSLKKISTQEELDKYILYISKNNLTWSELWWIFSHELEEDENKLKKYFDEKINEVNN